MTAPPFYRCASDKRTVRLHNNAQPSYRPLCDFFNRILDTFIFYVLNNISSLLNNRNLAGHYKTYMFPLFSGSDLPV